MVGETAAVQRIAIAAVRIAAAVGKIRLETLVVTRIAILMKKAEVRTIAVLVIAARPAQPSYPFYSSRHPPAT